MTQLEIANWNIQWMNRWFTGDSAQSKPAGGTSREANPSDHRPVFVELDV